MKNIFFLLCSFFVLLYSCTGVNNSKNKMVVQLNEGWKFTKLGANNWMNATVPGSVHTDLIDNGKIDDPYFRTNELELQWIDKEDWEYTTNFKVNSQLFDKERIELVFEGLDTYSDIFLNDRLILQTDNMFRKFEIDVKEYLNEGENKLRIIFYSPVKRSEKKYDALDYIIPVSDNDQSERGGLGEKRVSVFTRKAMYHFGWDWGPRLVTSGIWKPVFLKAWNSGGIKDFQIFQDKISDQKAELSTLLEVEAMEDQNYSIELYVDNHKYLAETVNLSKGINKVDLKLNIDNPQLWWPNGLGEQQMYVIKAVLKSEEEILDVANHTIGLRTIEVVQEPIGDKESFYFKVNGVPVFMKGANYIPQDVFLNRVTVDKYDHILQSMADANMNMVRVWGGGIYEKDIFYELCDRKGLLVWQDFMFACAMFPGDSAFLENVRMEAVDNIKRLRNHPSIALWCGNNECLSAWYQWGWREKAIKEQGKEVADKIWKAYTDIFHELLPEAVGVYDPGAFYWSSSPSEAPGVAADWNAGDQHYWGVWWGKEPFSTYATLYAPFMSEYGFQSFPELKTVKSYTITEDWDIYSDVMKSHQRSSIGNETIDQYMKRQFPDPKDFESFLYVGQVLQAEGVKVAMEGNRRVMPQCMGSLFWQIDDCWPVASWSSIDYYGRWKALQYYAKKAFNKFLVSPYSVDSSNVEIYCVSDVLEDQDAMLNVICKTFEGNEIYSQKTEIILKSNSADVYAMYTLPDTLNKNELVLYTSLEINNQIVSDNFFYFEPVKELSLPVPDLNYEITENESGYELKISTNNLARNVYIQTDGETFISDNYFDMMPQSEQTIFIKPSTNDKITLSDINIKSIIDAF